jgi:hypothetical protein
MTQTSAPKVSSPPTPFTVGWVGLDWITWICGNGGNEMHAPRVARRVQQAHHDVGGAEVQQYVPVIPRWHAELPAAAPSPAAAAGATPSAPRRRLGAGGRRPAEIGQVWRGADARDAQSRGEPPCAADDGGGEEADGGDADGAERHVGLLRACEVVQVAAAAVDGKVRRGAEQG